MLWTLFITGKRDSGRIPPFPLQLEAEIVHPEIAPFLAIIIGVMYVLYGGVATPSEAAGVGPRCRVPRRHYYRMWRRCSGVILRDTRASR